MSRVDNFISTFKVRKGGYIRGYSLEEQHSVSDQTNGSVFYRPTLKAALDAMWMELDFHASLHEGLSWK